MCDFTEDEIMAFAEHEHVPEIIATELAEYLIHTPEGVPVLRRYIMEDIAIAKEDNNWEHVEKLEMVLKHFIAKHPELTK